MRVGGVFRADGGVFKHWKRGSVSEKYSKKLTEGLWSIEWVCDNVGGKLVSPFGDSDC